MINITRLGRRFARYTRTALLLCGAGLSACSVQPSVPESTATLVAAASPDSVEQDRKAILAMLGEYKVKFEFQETVVLKPGYEVRDAKDTGAYETVVVVEDSARKISLQHLLLSDDGQHVTKHWRQDWMYQASERLEFSEDQTWRIRPLPADLIDGRWTQCVYEVSDAPRYCGTGSWKHEHGVSTWTSDLDWRPLPRREYTQRSDYNALSVVNRHSITPNGWTHEQDNTKVVRQGQATRELVVRETGFNDYRRVTDFNFAEAYDYWNSTAPYWARVRAQWERRIESGKGIHLKSGLTGMEMIVPMFGHAERVQHGTPVDDASIAEVFDTWTARPAPAPADATP